MLSKVISNVLRFKVELFLLLTLILVYVQWIIPVGYLTSGDWTFHDKDFLREFLRWPQIWESFSSLGKVDVMPTFNIFKFVYGIFSRWWNYAILERLVYFWPILVFSYSGVILLGKKLFANNKIGLFFFAILYLFNTFVLSLHSSFITYAGLYALAPLIFLGLINLSEKNHFSITNSVVFALTLFLGSLYEVRGLLALNYFLGLYLLYKLISSKDHKGTILLNFIFSYLILFLLNIYWFLPMVFTKNTYSVNASQGLFSAYNSIIDILALHNYPWQGNFFKPFTLEPFHKVEPSFYFFIIVPAMFSGFIFRVRDLAIKRIMLFLSVSTLIGFFLLKQQNEPYGEIYSWAFNKIPTFNMFRESNKFFIFLLPASLLFGYSMMLVMDSLKKIKLKIIIAGLATLIIFINIKPIITKEMGSLFVQREMPEDYIHYKDYLLSQNPDFRTLWVPTFSRWSFGSSRYPKISMSDNASTNWKGLIDSLFITDFQSAQDQVIMPFRKREFAQLLNVSGIKYVIVPLQDEENKDDFFVNFGQRNTFIHEISNAKYLKKINIEGSIALFENTTARPHLYLTDQIETIYKDTPYTKANFQLISPTQYKITLDKLPETPFYLNFSESFHEGWKLHIGSFNWWDALVKKNYFLLDKIHQKTDAGLNSFELHPSEIAKKDGSLEITLYFAPQSYVYLGSIVSGLSLVFLLALITYLAIKKRGRN